jgi:hypothetical protein
VDLIRSRKVPEVIRRNGATGNLPLPTEDKIEVLVFLAATADPVLSKQALKTLQACDGAEIRRVMASPQTPRDVLHFGAEQLAAGREDLRDVLLSNPSLPVESRIHLQRTTVLNAAHAHAAPKPPIERQSESLQSPRSPNLTEDSQANPESAPVPEAQPAPENQAEPIPLTEETAVEILARLAAGAKLEDVTGAAIEAPPEATMRDDELTMKDRETLIEKIGRMTVVEKIKAALTGNMETRVLLIRDSNKIISRAVLQSPKISETEAESYAAAKNVSEEVLRLLASNRKYMKAYNVMRALVNNPRAPIDVTMPLLIRMNERDLKGLTLNRNVPEVIRSLSIKLIKQREDAGKVKLGGKF